MTRRNANLFFTTDTLLAVIVLVSVFSLIQTASTTDGQADDPQRQLIELNRFLTQTTVDDLRSDYVGLYTAPNYQPQTDTWRGQLSVYQELLYLQAINDTNRSGSLARNISDYVISERFNYAYTVGNTTIASKVTTPKNQSSNHVVNRVLIYTLVNDGNQVYGPNQTKIAIWN